MSTGPKSELARTLKPTYSALYFIVKETEPQRDKRNPSVKSSRPKSTVTIEVSNLPTKGLFLPTQRTCEGHVPWWPGAIVTRAAHTWALWAHIHTRHMPFEWASLLLFSNSQLLQNTDEKSVKYKYPTTGHLKNSIVFLLSPRPTAPAWGRTLPSLCY